MLDVKKSAEVVDKLINHVCYKKTEGKLYLMANRLGWMTNTSEQFKISESYKNIRMQRVSQDEKDKVQLQLLIHSGSSYTFHFLHPEGRDHQLRDRNEVKNHLQHILPKFKDKATSELENKKKLFEKDPHLVELYRELVAGKYVCKEEFWARTETENYLSGIQDNASYPRGVASCLMTSLPESQALEKLVLSQPMLEDIFQVYPSVYEKYTKEVKSEKDTNEFMKRFFQSHYIHRTRYNLSEDMFVSCANIDIKAFQTVVKQLKEGYASTAVDRPSDLIASDETLQVIEETRSAHLNAVELLKRFNRHTFMLLKSMECDKQGLKRPLGEPDVDKDVSKIKRPMLSNIYNDAERLVYVEDEGRPQGVPFNTSKVTQYINQISDVNSGVHSSDRKRALFSAEEHRQRLLNLKKSLILVVANRPLVNLISSSVATDVLTTVGHLFSDAGVAPGSQAGIGLPSASHDVDSAMKALYRTTSELLRHFWGCFPITDAAGFERLHRLRDAIKKFKDLRLEAFLKDHPNAYILTNSMDHKATEHLTKMLDTALEAFNRYMENYNHVTKGRELQ